MKNINFHLKRRVNAAAIIPVVFLFLFAGNSVHAQKIGYIDSKKIIDNNQEAKDAKAKLDNFVSQWQKDLTTVQDSLKIMKDDYEKKKLILTEQMKLQKEKDIAAVETSIKEFNVKKFGEGGEYSQRQIELMKPIQDRIFKAIETVAKQDDYDYVFDRSSDIMLLYVTEKYDLTAKVQKIVEGK